MRNTFKNADVVIQQRVYNDMGNEFTLFPLEASKLYLKLNYICKNYYIILHDKDKNENGELKIPHFHLLLTFKSEVSQKNAVSVLAKLFDIPLNIISVRKCLLYDLSLAYLTHALDNNKFPYEPMSVICKYNDYMEIMGRNDITKTFSDSTIYNLIVDQGLAPVELIKIVGFEYYNKNHWVISTLYKGGFR